MSTNSFGIMLSSVGRRVELVQAFRRSLANLGVSGRVLGVDISPLAPAFHMVDAAWLVPSCSSPSFIPEVLALCERENIGLVVPTIDTELPMYARNRERFLERGVCVAVSAPETVSIGRDKRLTARWLSEHDIAVPRQATVEEALSSPISFVFPLIVKPRRGSGSIGIRTVTSPDELLSATLDRNEYLVEEKLAGTEWTANFYVDRRGNCRAIVPHERLEIRAGEVSKARTFKSPELRDVVKRVAEALPGAFGALNVQGFGTGEDIRIFEVNPRFGGGYPLAHESGAHFTTWLLEEALERDSDGTFFDEWKEGLTMLRYDQSVFLPAGGNEGA